MFLYSTQSTRVQKYKRSKTLINQHFLQCKTAVVLLYSSFLKSSLYILYIFIITLLKNRVQEYKNAKNSSKTLINQRFFLYSALYFAFYVKYKSTKTGTVAFFLCKIGIVNETKKRDSLLRISYIFYATAFFFFGT